MRVCRDGYRGLQALAISHRSGLQMAIVRARVHNTCYHFIALVGGGGALVIQVLVLLRLRLWHQMIIMTNMRITIINNIWIRLVNQVT